MSWFYKKHIIKLAAAKSKIERYKIANPSVKFFLYKYEDMIPWEEAEKVKQNSGDVESYIQHYINNNLLPNLSEQINISSPENNFLKPSSISDEDVTIELQNTELAQGRTPKSAYSPDLISRARSQILQDINNEKKLQFNEWWNYLNNEEETYINNPSFSFSILKPIIDSSPSDKKNSSPPLNAEVLAEIWDEINTKNSFHLNILKKYKKLSIKFEEKKSSKSDSIASKDGNWIRVKGGKDISGEELKGNIKTLKNLSQGTGWCTARGMANSHLPQGDFYIYIQNGESVVAIRCVENKVAEIRGHNNDQNNLDPYWKEVIEFLNKTNLEYSDNSHYQSLFNIFLMNENLEKGSDNYNLVLGQIKKNHTAYLKLSDKNKKNFPEFSTIAADGYLKILNEKLLKIEDINLSEDRYLYEFESFQEEYRKVPSEIKLLLGDVQSRILEAHRRAYYNNPVLFYDFPKDIQSKFSEKEQINGWINYIDIDPYHYNDERIPPYIKEYIPIQRVKDKFKELIKNNPGHIDYLPPDMFDPSEYKTFVDSILNDFSNYPVSVSFGELDKLKRVERLRDKGLISHQQILNILSRSIRNNPKWMTVLPETYQKELLSQGSNINTVFSEEEKNHVIRDPGYFSTLSAEKQTELLNKYGEEIGKAFSKEINKHRGLMHNFWISIPENARPFLPYEIIEATADYYINLINRNIQTQESILKKIPSDIYPIVLSKLPQGKNWFKKEQERPRN